MRRLMLIFLGVVGMWVAKPALAVPLLSLDIAGGTYDSASQTIVASGNPFTVYALLNTLQGQASGTYYIAAAIVPKTQNPPTSSFGSFTVNGQTYSAANMSYGNPPASITHESRD